MTDEPHESSTRPATRSATARSGIRPSRYSKWRAATLASVYLLMVVHVIHWKVSGKTLAPLEVHEVMYTLELGS